MPRLAETTIVENLDALLHSHRRGRTSSRTWHSEPSTWRLI